MSPVPSELGSHDDPDAEFRPFSPPMFSKSTDTPFTARIAHTGANVPDMGIFGVHGRKSAENPL